MKKLITYNVQLIKEESKLYNIDNIGINSPSDCSNIIKTVLDLESSAVEKFGILCLDTKNNVRGIHIISVGTLNSSLVHPREVFQRAILNNSNSIILFHNHPSGDPTPSSEDITMTKRIDEAGKILGISVLDHVITGDSRYVSLKERGIL